MPDDKRRNLFDVAEKLAGSPSADRAQKWVWGVGLSSVIAGYAIKSIWAQKVLFVRGRPLGLVETQGVNAVAVCTMYLSAALFIHCHWFWSDHPVYHGYAMLGKIVGLIGVIIAMAWLFYRVIFLL